MPWPFSDAALEEILAKSGVKLLKPGQYMDKWRLDRSGIGPWQHRIKRALGSPKSSLRASKRRTARNEKDHAHHGGHGGRGGRAEARK